MYKHLKYNISQDTIHSVTNLVQNNYILSKNGKFTAKMQDDGNFTLFETQNPAKVPTERRQATA